MLCFWTLSLLQIDFLHNDKYFISILPHFLLLLGEQALYPLNLINDCLVKVKFCRSFTSKFYLEGAFLDFSQIFLYGSRI